MSMALGAPGEAKVDQFEAEVPDPVEHTVQAGSVEINGVDHGASVGHVDVTGSERCAYRRAGLAAQRDVVGSDDSTPSSRRSSMAMTVADGRVRAHHPPPG
jgi:hypothetical protein